MKGILADIHLKGPVGDLVRAMQAEPWAEFWENPALVLFQFEDVGLNLDRLGNLAPVSGGRADMNLSDGKPRAGYRLRIVPARLSKRTG